MPLIIGMVRCLILIILLSHPLWSFQVVGWTGYAISSQSVLAQAGSETSKGGIAAGAIGLYPLNEKLAVGAGFGFVPMYSQTGGAEERSSSLLPITANARFTPLPFLSLGLGLGYSVEMGTDNGSGFAFAPSIGLEIYKSGRLLVEGSGRAFATIGPRSSLALIPSVSVSYRF